MQLLQPSSPQAISLTCVYIYIYIQYFHRAEQSRLAVLTRNLKAEEEKLNILQALQRGQLEYLTKSLAQPLSHTNSMQSAASQQDTSQQAESDRDDAEDHSYTLTETREAPLQAKAHNHEKVI